MSSSRIHCTLTGTPPACFDTAATSQTLSLASRRPKPPPPRSWCSVTFSFGKSPETLDLESDREELTLGGLGLGAGMNVISRGQTYYHRPGNWTEQPNFFNPYWRPRLAAVWQGKDSLPLIGSMASALPDAFQDSPAQLITH